MLYEVITHPGEDENRDRQQRVLGDAGIDAGGYRHQAEVGEEYRRRGGKPHRDAERYAGEHEHEE